ncbi:hypothetical protein V8C35DRAFT_313621 [Trichoderma chlorosporum]
MAGHDMNRLVAATLFFSFISHCLSLRVCVPALPVRQSPGLSKNRSMQTHARATCSSSTPKPSSGFSRPRGCRGWRTATRH